MRLREIELEEIILIIIKDDFEIINYGKHFFFKKKVIIVIFSLM